MKKARNDVPGLFASHLIEGSEFLSCGGFRLNDAAASDRCLRDDQCTDGAKSDARRHRQGCTVKERAGNTHGDSGDNELQRPHQRRCRAGDFTVIFKGKHTGRREDKPEEAVADEEEGRHDRQLIEAKAMTTTIATMASEKPVTALRITRTRPKRAPSQPVSCDTAKNDTALIEKAKLYCVGVNP